MLGFLRRMLTADAEPTPAEQDKIEASKRELDQTRGEYRQAVLRIEANVRLLRQWENANRMVRE